MSNNNQNNNGGVYSVFMGFMLVISCIGSCVDSSSSSTYRSSEPKTVKEVIERVQMVEDYRAAQRRKADGTATLSDHFLW